LKFVYLCFSYPDLFEKCLNAFHFGSFLHNLNNYSGKTKCANDLKFCTKISGLYLDLHQMVHLSGKNIFSPIMSKQPQWSPFNKTLVEKMSHHSWDFFYWLFKLLKWMLTFALLFDYFDCCILYVCRYNEQKSAVSLGVVPEDGDIWGVL
jgi:hypothetical protein